MDVALFITCLTDTFAPRVGVAVVRVLRHFGCTVHFPPNQTCCGQPAYNNGFLREAAALGRRMVDVFEGYPHVVTPSGSCASMVIHHTPELLKDDVRYAARARDLAGRTHEFGGFLRDVLKVDVAAIPVRSDRPLTFHYSCHMRGIEPAERSARLVSGLGGVDYRPVEQMEQCCGFGGAFYALYPNISQAITQEKVDRLAATGAQTVICNEAGCTFTLEGAARRMGRPLRFLHLAEVLAESLGLMEDEP
jgi:L-lactate dehydrogenase complex protein LldE